MTAFTTQRQIPLTIPQSQNTAPVLEFRCLYTHDLRQKKKRWQDGRLRFHTFNKRVMVYDESRNYIGDTHCKQGEAIGEGEELSLDKGVLIQVEEQMGRVEQDLTPLLEITRHAQHETTATNSSVRGGTFTRTEAASTRVSSAAATPVNPLRPKTLNAVLGTVKGAYGRAALSRESPFQVRNENSLNVIAAKDTESPSKRRRLNDSTSDNHHSKAHNTSCQPKEETAIRPRCFVPSKSALTVERPTRPHDIITVDSDEETSSSASPIQVTPRSTKESRTSRTAIVNTHLQRRRNAASTNATDPERTPQHRDATIDPDPALVKPAPVLPQHTNSLPSESVTPKPVPPEPEKPLKTLRFASSKPRKKLMYKDLLPKRPPSPASDMLSQNTVQVDHARPNMDLQRQEACVGDGSDRVRSSNIAESVSVSDNVEHQPPQQLRSPLHKSLSENNKPSHMPNQVFHIGKQDPSGPPRLRTSASDPTSLHPQQHPKKGPKKPEMKTVNVYARSKQSIVTALKCSRYSNVQEPKEGNLGPWSREAFDLFGWKIGDKKGAERMQEE